MMRLSELTGRRVQDGKGNALGRVVEVRSPGRPESRPRDEPRKVGMLLYGRRGLLERLGWVEPHPQQVDWREVDVIDERTLRVDAGALRATKQRNALERRRDAAQRSSVEPRDGADAAGDPRPAGKVAAKKAKKTKAKRKAHASQPQKAKKGAASSKERKEC